MKFYVINKPGNQPADEISVPDKELVNALEDKQVSAIRIKELNKMSKGDTALYNALCSLPLLPLIILDGKRELKSYKEKLPILNMVDQTGQLTIKDSPQTNKNSPAKPNPLKWFKDIHDHLCATWTKSNINGIPPGLVKFVNLVHELMNWSPHALSAKRLELGHTDEAGSLLAQNYAELARHSFEHESGKTAIKATQNSETCSLREHETVILWIENNPFPLLEQIEHLLKWFDIRLHLIWKPESLRTLLNELKKTSQSSRITEIKNIQAQEINTDNIQKYLDQTHLDENSFKPPVLNLTNFDYALVDLYLDKDLDGRDYIRQLMTVVPELPVVALSAIRELREIQDTLDSGADAFLRKKNTIFLPNVLESVKRRIGPITGCISDSRLRRNLRGNIRFWSHHRSCLWHGDKCYHMINHSWSHASSVWRLANKLIVKLMEYQRLKPSNEELYAFAMSVWLHDIGHKGSHRFGEGFAIRHLHGILSAEILCSNPDLYGICGFRQRPSQYADCRFDPPDTVLGEIRKRVLRTTDVLHYSKENTRHLHPFILEKTALLCLYHNSRNPINEDEYLNLTAKGKSVPAEIFEQADYVKKPIFLEHLVSLMEQAENKPSQLTSLLLLLRFVDAIDIGKWRVGEHTEKSLKLDVNQRDCEYLFGRLEQEVIKISDILPKDAKKTFETLFYKEAVQNLRMSQGIPDHIRERQNAFSDSNSIGEALSIWRQVIEYLTFIVATKSHFDLHAVFDRVDLDINRNHSGTGITLTITWTANRPIEWLKNRHIHEAGDTKNRTLPDHILGTENHQNRDGYIAKELLAGGEHLKELILGPEDNIKIKIKGTGGEGDMGETLLNRETLQIQ